ncbi:hypothetical protein PhaeoP18_02884 [Phaeobacter piscinae]|uniref:Uncharacterized protein n=1 Tax=Phaeobacter piscinae TaxID=1580596 RepID=A0AAN1LBP5_9RHOB|nr:hypothetical protein [Phaeobacter piscinae]ATG44806.1 hypothetical protein PhaeoP13_02905 [Phaeobacter piscinae]AUR37120.1 hypothetical protein PhaeoP18_02884 [Phaeobacter piscinae]
MNYTSSDWRLAVTNLLKKTSKGEVTWNTSDLFKGDAWTFVDRSFQCGIGDKTYVVSETRTKYFLDEEEFIWDGGFDFSVFEGLMEPQRLASAPKDLSIIKNLFKAAEDSFAFKSNALGDLL